MYVCLCLHVEWSIIRLSPEMAYSRGSRYEHRARLALPNLLPPQTKKKHTFVWLLIKAPILSLCLNSVDNVASPSLICHVFSSLIIKIALQ